jgi:hypothetical protein
MPQRSPRPPRRVPILLLAALMAALALPCFAAAASTPAPVPTADASFVASLAAAPAATTALSTPGLAPVPIFLQTGAGCTRDSQCPTGKLCCPACRFPPCTKMACYTPVRGICP